MFQRETGSPRPGYRVTCFRHSCSATGTGIPADDVTKWRHRRPLFCSENNHDRRVMRRASGLGLSSGRGRRVSLSPPPRRRRMLKTTPCTLYCVQYRASRVVGNPRRRLDLLNGTISRPEAGGCWSRGGDFTAGRRDVLTHPRWQKLAQPPEPAALLLSQQIAHRARFQQVLVRADTAIAFSLLCDDARRSTWWSDLRTLLPLIVNRCLARSTRGQLSFRLGSDVAKKKHLGAVFTIADRISVDVATALYRDQDTRYTDAVAGWQQ